MGKKTGPRPAKKLDGAKALRLRAEGLSWAQVAERMGCNEGSLYRACRRAKKQVKLLVTALVFIVILVSTSLAEPRHRRPDVRRSLPPPRGIQTEVVQRPVLNKEQLVLHEYFFGKGAAFEGLPISKLIAGPPRKKEESPAKRYHWGL